MTAEAGIVEQEEVAIDRQRRGKYILVGTN
jgi:hypothetical protein